MQNNQNLSDIQAAKEDFHHFVCDLQSQIVAKMHSYDPSLEIIEDMWQRKDIEGNPGGGGRTRALKGKVFENAGVNVSCVSGAIDEGFAKSIGASRPYFWASGISLILHPFNPRLPTVHANFRMIQGGDKVWFGGGADLTPFYPNVEDFEYFHKTWQKACAPYGSYNNMKQTCDEYFVNKHRDNEMRGVGGIFFDHWNSNDLAADMQMVKHLANHFIESYFPLVEKRKDEDFTANDEEFMLHRRGRYVEFNLLHDRGTTFGLKSKGRTESILISLPARCRFSYDYRPKDPAHLQMLEYYRPKDWV